MTDWIINSESPLRLSVFFSVLILMLVLEALFPRKARVEHRGQRWPANLLLVIIDSLVIRLIFPIIAVGVATYAASNGWGVLNIIKEATSEATLPIPSAVISALIFILALILLDLSVYVQHVAFHKIPGLWRLHKVHHADRDIDVTTGVRFHPLEIVISMLYKMAVVLLLGPSALAVIVFEIILNASAMFNHANLKLPKTLDKVLRILIVTPDMHRVHHSVDAVETDRNYGFNLSIWDRIFKTYTAQPKAGHAGMTIGLSEYQTKASASLLWMLTLPFKRNL